jgi:hypothetical protein
VSRNTACLHLRGSRYRIPPTCRQERDFCHRRLAPRKRLRDDISKQRLEIGDNDAREMAAKGAFPPVGFDIGVSADCLVGAPGLEPGTR